MLVPTSTSPGLPFRPPFLATWQRLKDAKRLQQQQAEQHTQANPLRHYRLQQNLSYKELSQLSGLDRSTLRKLEQGRIRARASTVQKLAQALQIPLSELEYLGQDHYPCSGGTARIRRKDYDAELPQQQLRGGKLLLRLRLERGMTQVELAGACGTKRAVISWLENEVYPAKKDKHLQRIAHYLGVSPAGYQGEIVGKTTLP